MGSEIERNHIAELTSQIHALGEEKENLRIALHRILSVGFIQTGYMSGGKPYGYYEHTADGHEECHAIADLAYRGLFDSRRQ